MLKSLVGCLIFLLFDRCINIILGKFGSCDESSENGGERIGGFCLE